MDSSKNPIIDERFGRAQMFCIINNKGDFKVIENTAKGQTTGAGGQAVKILADEDVDTIISPHIGPKAMNAISALKIEVFKVGNAKTVKEAIDMLNSGNLELDDYTKPGLKRV